MEKGTIQSYDKAGGAGVIRRLGCDTVTFNAQSVLGRDRLAIKQGDMVSFEVENVNSFHVAINIRKI